MKQRRTKIIATICDATSSVDHIRSFLKCGMDIIRVNMAYCTQKVNNVLNLDKNYLDFGNNHEK